MKHKRRVYGESDIIDMDKVYKKQREGEDGCCDTKKPPDGPEK
tara:strand:+ start:3215 stop:3343 length:129 start_codon:yes stop_codon:yes gene_type:complete